MQKIIIKIIQGMIEENLEKKCRKMQKNAGKMQEKC